MRDQKPARANQPKDLPKRTPDFGNTSSSALTQLQKNLGNRATLQLLRNHAQSKLPIQRIEDSEIESLVAWWDAWLTRAIAMHYIAESEKAEWLEKGRLWITENKKLSKKDLQIGLDQLLRKKVPVEEGDHIPIEFRVPKERLEKGKLVESLKREAFIPKIETQAKEAFQSMAHTLHHKISDAVLRALAGRLAEALNNNDAQARRFFEVLSQQARLGASVKDEAVHGTGPLREKPTARELYKQLTNAPLNLEPGPRAGDLRDSDNDAGSTFDGNTVPTDEDDGAESGAMFAPTLSIRSDPVPWNPRNRRLSVRSAHLFKIFLLAEKMYANNRYTPTSEEWAQMTLELSQAVAEHNRLLRVEGEKSVGLVAPRMEQWMEHGGKHHRKHTEEGLVLAHDHKREIGDGDALSEKEKLELKKQQDAEKERQRKLWAEKKQREEQEEAEALTTWLENAENMQSVLQDVLGKYEDQVKSLNTKLLLYIANGSGQVDKKMRDAKWKKKQTENEKSKKEWATLLKKKAEEVWKKANKPGLEELRAEKAKATSTSDTATGGGAAITVAEDSNHYVYTRVFDDYRAQYPQLVQDNGELPQGIVNPEVVDEVLPLDQQSRATAARSEHLVEMADNNEGLSTWLDAQGITVAPNSGNRMNCLIISLLQHATEEYGSDHLDEANTIRARLIEEHDEIGENEMLHSDNAAVTWLVAHINTEYGVDINPIFVRGDEHGRPFILPINSQDGTRVVIWDQGGHYVALYRSA